MEQELLKVTIETEYENQIIPELTQYEIHENELSELSEISKTGNIKKFIYTVYCKDLNGITLLNKAFIEKDDAYNYAVTKISKLLAIINTEFVQNTKEKIMPLECTLINLHYKLNNDIYEKYIFFQKNYKRFFFVAKLDPIMFFVSTLELI